MKIKNICDALSLTDNIHWMFSSPVTEKKNFSFKRMVIAVKTICAETCYQARLSDKNICSVIFVVGNIYHIYHNKIFSFKMKLQNQLPLPFCWGWQPSVSNFEKGGCKRFAVQTLLWSLEFVIQINLKLDTITECFLSKLNQLKEIPNQINKKFDKCFYQFSVSEHVYYKIICTKVLDVCNFGLTFFVS